MTSQCLAGLAPFARQPLPLLRNRVYRVWKGGAVLDRFQGQPTRELIALFDASGRPISGDVSSALGLWDAGTEVNEEPGVGPDADEKAIRSAFRRLAREHHPDVNPGNAQSAEKFKDINEAYQVLSDPQKKAEYDQVGHAEFRPGDAERYRPPSYDDLFRDFGLGDIFDVFSTGSRKTRVRAGADLWRRGRRWRPRPGRGKL